MPGLKNLSLPSRVQQFIEKEKLDKVDDNNYNLRFSLNNELPQNDLLNKNKKLLEINSYEKTYRFKNRYSIKTDDNLFLIDMSSIKMGHGKTFKESTTLKEPLKYEIEIEFIGKDSELDTSIICKKLLYYIEIILKMLQNTTILLTNTIINNQTIKPIIEDNTKQTSINNTINYDLCLTSNNNKSCSPDNKIINDPYNLPNKFKINKDLKKEIRKNYKSHLKFDSIDMWGKLINDRNYYTSPNIEIVNDQSGFAEWCYTNNGGSGKCKTDGSNCVKDRDVRYHKGRISSNSVEKNN
jgi:hypothetical protein